MIGGNCGNGSNATMVGESEKYIRILLYGGAMNKSDNSSFYFASENVKNDYSNDGTIIHKSIDSAAKIINLINAQADNSIQSLDFFAHGDMFGIYFIKGSNIFKDISEEEVEKNNLNASLYLGSYTKLIYGSDLHDESDVIQNIKFSKFTFSSKIEIHGCLTAAELYITDNIAEELSVLLFNAGKKESIVIGHSTKANPNINGAITTDAEQDYRHEERIVFNNGTIILKTIKKGRITADEINKALNNK